MISPRFKGGKKKVDCTQSNEYKVYMSRFTNASESDNRCYSILLVDHLYADIPDQSKLFGYFGDFWHISRLLQFCLQRTPPRL